MRRKDREVTDFHEMIDIMKKCDSCIVAMNDGDFPYVVPMNFGLEVQEEQVFLYFHCATKGKKLDLLKQNHHVTFEMDCDHDLVLCEERMDCTMGYSSVIGHGTIDKVADEDKYDALKIIMRQYHVEDFKFNTDMMKVTTVLRLTVTDITAKRNH